MPGGQYQWLLQILRRSPHAQQTVPCPADAHNQLAGLEHTCLFSSARLLERACSVLTLHCGGLRNHLAMIAFRMRLATGLTILDGSTL